MSKKVIRNCMLIMAVCFLILGILFKSNAERQKGIQATTGIMIDQEELVQIRKNMKLLIRQELRFMFLQE